MTENDLPHEPEPLRTSIWLEIATFKAIYYLLQLRKSGSPQKLIDQQTTVVQAAKRDAEIHNAVSAAIAKGKKPKNKKRH